MAGQIKEGKGPKALSLEEMEQVTGGNLIEMPQKPDVTVSYEKINTSMKKYVCKCGFKTDSATEAMNHSQVCKQGWATWNGTLMMG